MFQSEHTDELCPFCGQHLPEMKEDCFWIEGRARGHGGIVERIMFECPQCDNEVTFVYHIDDDGDMHYDSTEYDDGDMYEEERLEYAVEQREQTRRDNMFERYEMGL